jgi:CRP/FNR family transcriptional regulator
MTGAVMDILIGLSPEGRNLLGKGLIRHAFPAGKVIIEKGREVSGAYFVLGGQLRVFAYTPSGREATLYLIRPGETCVLALNSLFNNLLYPAWVETEQDTEVGVVSGAVYRQLFQSERVVQDLTVRALSTVVFRLMAELEQVHACRLDQRLASLLLTHAAGDGTLRKTQQQIADHMGTTREVVARLMSEFVARGLVVTGRGWVRVAQATGLAELVRAGEG